MFLSIDTDKPARKLCKKESFPMPAKLIYSKIMTVIQKFLSDVERTKKVSRQKGVMGGYNSIRQELAKLFENATTCPADLPHSLFEYWENKYIFTSADLTWEPETANSERLAGMLALLEDSDEYFDTLSEEDWQEIGRLVNFEAEDLPVEILQQLMAVLVSKGAY